MACDLIQRRTRRRTFFVAVLHFLCFFHSPTGTDGFHHRHHHGRKRPFSSLPQPTSPPPPTTTPAWSATALSLTLNAVTDALVQQQQQQLLPQVVTATATAGDELSVVLQDYSPAATALFNNMKTPASILAAGMISIGFLAPFNLPSSILDQPVLVRRIELLKRAYILVTLVSFCSELLAVMWATVAVNQLTERSDILPAASVWDLLQRECDLAWAAVNSHFVVGLIGFMYMVGIRGYLMLLAAEASEALIAATLSGVGSALLLMVSVVNRGVEAGGGKGVNYGTTVLDLFYHYVVLLYERAVNVESFGPLELSAIVLEVVSVFYALSAILFPGVVGEKNDSREERLAQEQQHQPEHPLQQPHQSSSPLSQRVEKKKKKKSDQKQQGQQGGFVGALYAVDDEDAAAESSETAADNNSSTTGSPNGVSDE